MAANPTPWPSCTMGTSLHHGNSRDLRQRIRRALASERLALDPAPDHRASAVLFLLADRISHAGRTPEPCLILTKRSHLVPQPGDLCCPGGRLSPVDRLGAHLLRLPGTLLSRWPHWRAVRRRQPAEAGRLALLLAAALRESVEEMRLNPLDVTFLGPLPAQPLVMFRRIIHPLAGWIGRQRRFVTNREVDRVVPVPIRHLLDPARHARFRLPPRDGSAIRREFGCVVLTGHADAVADHLWGATYRITMDFLHRVFGFQPPRLEALPAVAARLPKNYYGDKGRS